MIHARPMPLPAGPHNIRDLGGLPRAGGGATLPGRVLRACAMQGLPAEGRGALVAGGLSTVIDLRSDAERAAVPPPFAGVAGVETRALPLFADLAPITVMMGDDPGFRLETRYVRALEIAAPRFAAVIGAIAEAAPGMVLFHCTAGKDRTGLIAALLLGLAGVERDAVVADYARTATEGAALIADLRARGLAAGADPATLATILASPPEAMAATLAVLDARFGGAAGYLADAGLPPAAAAAAAARLVA